MTKRSRFPQDFIDELLLSDEGEQKTLGRLLASQAWPGFEAWLEAEGIDDSYDADKVTNVLVAIVTFAGMIISGVSGEHWPIHKQEVADSILRLAKGRLDHCMSLVVAKQQERHGRGQ